MDFSFIQITDHHLGPTEHSYNHGYATAWALRRVMDHIALHNAWGADFLITTGDLVNAGTDDEYGFARRFLSIEGTAHPPGPLSVSWGALRRFPAHFIPGNHDPREAFYRNLFPTATPGPRPVPDPGRVMNAAFEHKGVQCLYLDWGIHHRTGEVTPETLHFLREKLAARTPTIIFLHHHPIPVGIKWLDDALPERIQEFWDVAAAGRVLGVLFGHTHATVETIVRGIPVLGLRSTNFQFAPADQPLFCLLPPHYRVVSVSSGMLTSRIHEVPL